jgi:hypothetical protein
MGLIILYCFLAVYIFSKKIENKIGFWKTFFILLVLALMFMYTLYLG